MKRVALVVALSVMLASCAVHKSTTATKPARVTVNGSVAGSPSPTGGQTGGASMTPTPTAGAAGGSAKPDSTAKPASAKLDRACIHQRSSELQGLTVVGRPKATIGYSTEYSDHSNELTNRSYTTGFGYGVAGPDGTYRATWAIPASAPSGVAIVHLIASAGEIQPTVSFRIVAAGGRCP